MAITRKTLDRDLSLVKDRAYARRLTHVRYNVRWHDVHVTHRESGYAIVGVLEGQTGQTEFASGMTARETHCYLLGMFDAIDSPTHRVAPTPAGMARAYSDESRN